MLPDGEVGFLDWQMARRGNWSLDLGYFLQGALTIEDRRRSERELLEEYRGALTLPAAEMPSAEELCCATAPPSHTGWRSGWPRCPAASLAAPRRLPRVGAAVCGSLRRPRQPCGDGRDRLAPIFFAP